MRNRSTWCSIAMLNNYRYKLSNNPVGQDLGKWAGSVRFEKIKLNGFKGFVDPVEFDIRDGLSGIVGPNGCGKSNLVEAIGWVMGENRPSIMRGEAMEDVIFSGAASRPARSFAEVVLEIDNSLRAAPTAFNGDDRIEIARRISREHGSSYRANGKDVRWRDIQVLFADSASGSRSSALVRQGQISDLINAKPAARSGVLEDAAGIAGLFQRRREAELKLSATENNLERLQDIIEQHNSRVNSLEKQARQAERYKKLAAQLRDAEAILLCLKWNEAKAAYVAVKSELDEAVGATLLLEAKAAKISGERSEIESTLPRLRLEAGQAEAGLHRLMSEQSAIKEQMTRTRQLIQSLAVQISQIEIDLERESNLCQDATSMIAELEAQKHRLEQAAADHDDKMAAIERELAQFKTKLGDREKTLDREKEQAAALSANLQTAQRRLSDARTELTNSKSRERSVAAEVRREKTKLAEAGARVELAAGEKSNAEKCVERSEHALAESEAARFEAQSDLSKSQSALSEAESRLKALSSECAELRKLLNSTASDEAKILNRISVAPGFEKAVGAAFGDDLFAAEVGASSSSGWKELPAYEDASPLPPGTELLSKHVQAPPLLARRLMQIGLAESSDVDRLQPMLRPGQRIVTKSGDLCRWDGFRTASDDTPNAAALRLSQINRLNELSAKMKEAEAKADKAARSNTECAEKFREISEADKAARVDRRDAEMALAEANRKLAQAEAESGIAEKSLEALSATHVQARSATEGARTALKKAEAAKSNCKDPESASEMLAAVRKEVETARSDLIEASALHDAMKRGQIDRGRHLSQIDNELGPWRLRLNSASDRMAEMTGRKSRLKEEHRDASATPARLEKKRTEIDRQLELAEVRRKQSADALAEMEGLFRKVRASETDANKSLSDARETKARLDAKIESAAAQMDDAAKRITDQCAAPPERIAKQFNVLDECEVQSEEKEVEVNRLRRSLDSLGAVNLRAEQDIADIRRELDELTSECGDLESAVRTLRSSISSLNDEGSERLQSAFMKVDENFTRLFKILFGGGNARLELVRGDDPLDTGIEILCHPPGKRFSTLSLLSGGEQTLTAIALIFAFFLVNPAPICVLDEVDAPLDDANVSRFCDLLKEIASSTKTRFLVITHHSITMSRMDRLFGVTMQERGVSQLVSVDLGEAERFAA